MGQRASHTHRNRSLNHTPKNRGHSKPPSACPPYQPGPHQREPGQSPEKPETVKPPESGSPHARPPRQQPERIHTNPGRKPLGTIAITLSARIFQRAGLTGGAAFFAGVTGLIVACGYDRGRVVAPGWASSSTGRIGWCCRGRTGGSTGSGGCEGGQAVVCGGEQIGPGGWAVSRILDGFLGVFLRSSGCCCAVVGECLEWGSVAQG